MNYALHSENDEAEVDELSNSPTEITYVPCCWSENIRDNKNELGLRTFFDGELRLETLSSFPCHWL